MQSVLLPVSSNSGCLSAMVIVVLITRPIRQEAPFWKLIRSTLWVSVTFSKNDVIRLPKTLRCFRVRVRVRFRVRVIAGVSENLFSVKRVFEQM